jgi:hypothetical protein
MVREQRVFFGFQDIDMLNLPHGKGENGVFGIDFTIGLSG